MTIVHRWLGSGCFVAGDTESGTTSYAYPTSKHATIARRLPDRVAAEMIRGAVAAQVPADIRRHYDDMMWSLLRQR